jgi:ATP-dependent DNA helicase RecQ
MEGSPIELKANFPGNGWSIFTPNNQKIGYLSHNATEFLRNKGIQAGQFEFQSHEVTVKYIYHHIKKDEITAEVLEDWFVVIPQIRVCRSLPNLIL